MPRGSPRTNPKPKRVVIGARGSRTVAMTSDPPVKIVDDPRTSSEPPEGDVSVSALSEEIAEGIDKGWVAGEEWMSSRAGSGEKTDVNCGDGSASGASTPVLVSHRASSAHFPLTSHTDPSIPNACLGRKELGLNPAGLTKG